MERIGSLMKVSLKGLRRLFKAIWKGNRYVREERRGNLVRLVRKVNLGDRRLIGTTQCSTVERMRAGWRGGAGGRDGLYMYISP